MRCCWRARRRQAAQGPGAAADHIAHAADIDQGVFLADLGDHAAHRWSLPIAPPHAAGLSAGAIRRVPVIRDGAIVPGEELELTLACDHRILFGSRAAAFLARIADLLVGARQ